MRIFGLERRPTVVRVGCFAPHTHAAAHLARGIQLGSRLTDGGVESVLHASAECRFVVRQIRSRLVQVIVSEQILVGLREVDRRLVIYDYVSRILIERKGLALNLLVTFFLKLLLIVFLLFDFPLSVFLG